MLSTLSLAHNLLHSSSCMSMSLLSLCFPGYSFRAPSSCQLANKKLQLPGHGLLLNDNNKPQREAAPNGNASHIYGGAVAINLYNGEHAKWSS